MSMVASPPDGYAQLGWRRIGATAAAFCLAPALLGALIVLAAKLLGPSILGPNHLRTEGMATFAMISPLIGAPIWTVVALGSAGLMRLGSYGWLPAALLGAAAFGVLSRTGIGDISLPFGAVSVLLFRMALALQRPAAV
jgi:hypothetical protein